MATTTEKPIRLDDDSMDYGRPMRERYEDFAGHFVTTRNPMQAYRLAFVVDKAKTVAWVNDQARRLMRDPGIMTRVQALRDAAAALTLASVRDLIQDYHDIATADPNELVSIVHDACRWCFGIDHRYQWLDMAEYTASADVCIRKGQPMPDMSGGFGFTPLRDPNMTCPHCFGRGTPKEIMRDTTQLSPQARKLYKGVKLTAAGPQIEMHDQMAAREALGRVLGAFKDGIPVTPAVPHMQAITKDTKEADAGRAYLRLVSGGKNP